MSLVGEWVGGRKHTRAVCLYLDHSQRSLISRCQVGSEEMVGKAGFPALRGCA